MAFSPLKASRAITAQYRRYLSTVFQIRNPEYRDQFTQQLEQMRMLSSGPFLDVHDNFATGASTRQLVEEGVLPRSFLRLGFMHDRPLYMHQEQAVRRVLAGRNLVVSTGTGSGKTESFLIPILASLAQECEQGRLSRGVRALLVYPMNALANDQVERLRALLQDYPEITFGCYTGQTQPDYERALHEYRKLNRGAVPARNELISRDEMKQNPPHLLITNYAMLEYLMVRPGDSVFFERDEWKFVVLDEAHTYRGSTGIEVAMLLRRLQASLRGKALQYILTSATLGAEDENDAVAAFASDLCCSPFTAEDVIRGQRTPVPPAEDPLDVPASQYAQLNRQLEQGADEAALGERLQRMYPQWRLRPDAPLFDMVHRDRRYWQLRNALAKPRSIEELMGETGMTGEEIADFVSVAACCEADGVRLFDARYHMFLRATESVFLTIGDAPRLFLNRQRSILGDDGLPRMVFEACTCSACHALYLMGKLDDRRCLTQHSEDKARDVYYLGSAEIGQNEDSDMDDPDMAEAACMICAVCGHVRRTAVRGDSPCQHGACYEVPATNIRAREGVRSVRRCVACEAVNNYGVLRTFFTGQEAVTSVIATSLFNELPSARIETRVQTVTDDFGFGFGGAGEETTQEVRQAKQFLCFSDSRQASAYFASYMDTTYRKLLYKRLMNEAMQLATPGMALTSYVELLQDQFLRYDILQDSHLRAEKESWKAIMAEAADQSGGASLYSMGLFALGVTQEELPANPALNLSREDVTTLINVLLQSLLQDGALALPVVMTEEDRSFFSYSTVPCTYQLAGSVKQQNLRGFVPTKAHMSNKRLDYLERVLALAKPDFDPQRLRPLLETLWGMISMRLKLLTAVGDGYQLDGARLKVLRPSRWYCCSKCRHLTPFSIRQVCPTYGCEGVLRPINPEVTLRDNHYWNLYHNMDLRPLRIREHTAQLDRNTAYQYQQDFKEKRLDVLSCSTTFEMGVDVGSLETVFMRNMPPLPSNYAQRAGRAGRSRHSAAFALTFCNRSNHDFACFADPVAMITGEVHALRFSVLNEKIAIRHLYASALACFWHAHPEYFKTVKRMAEPGEEGGADGVTLLADYLRGKPQEVREYLRAFLPPELYQRFGCDDFAWVESLLGPDDGKLTMAVEEYRYEVKTLRDAIQEAFEHERSTGYLLQRVRNYEREDILSFMSRRNIMPQYGFPVDTVPLMVANHADEAGFGVELQRDLSMAIAEYAPGSEIVANGRLFTGRYIRKVPRIGWKMYDYVTCEGCGTLNIELHVNQSAQPQLESCHVCGMPLDTDALRTFLVPSFGFSADPNNVRKPGLIRPQRSFRGDAAYVGYRAQASLQRIRIGGRLASIQYAEKDEMAVLNRSNFYVCESCGYAEKNAGFTRTIEQRHLMPSGRPCGQTRLYRYSLGYRFETDVFQLRFLDDPLTVPHEAEAQSVLYGIMRGVTAVLGLEEQDVQGCLQCYLHPLTGEYCYGLVYYDATPGGAGHVKRMMDPDVLEKVLHSALQILRQCTCGGAEGDASCYTCLRMYRNQKYHDMLKRRSAIDFIQRMCAAAPLA